MRQSITFTIEVEVTATIDFIEGGGNWDEPPWSEVSEVWINNVDMPDNLELCDIAKDRFSV